MYKLSYTEPALKDLLNLDKKHSKRITDKILFFSQQNDIKPFSKSLSGFEGRFRFRIGDYRAIFKIDKSGNIQIIMILNIKHRKDIYDL